MTQVKAYKMQLHEHETNCSLRLFVLKDMEDMSCPPCLKGFRAIVNCRCSILCQNIIIDISTISTTNIKNKQK